ncbi:hypothetical protein [Phocaeicola coprocola]|nr:hypothetical protein [Phocaeicola coprocola]
MITDKNGVTVPIAYPVHTELDRNRNKILNLTYSRLNTQSEVKL